MLPSSLATPFLVPVKSLGRPVRSMCGEARELYALL